MAYERPRSPAGWGESVDGYGRDPYGRPPSPRRDDYPPAGMDDPYRRARSPEDDRRKRRRSPSPVGRAIDTYIPSYTRDRSPPYRERGRDHYGGGYGGQPDRYDSRSAYAPRDAYDQYAPPSSGYDRPARGAPPPRSQLKPPSELPYLAPFSYFRDWIRDEDHRTYDDKEKLDEAYRKYKLGFLAKHQRIFFDEIKEMSWCKEKYGISQEEVAERAKLKEKGREGKLEAFLAALEGGELDDLLFEQKLAPASPPKKAKELEVAEDAKVEDADGATKAKEEEEESKPAENGAKMEEDEAVKTEPKAEEEDAQMQENGNDAKPDAEGDQTEDKPATGDEQDAQTQQRQNGSTEDADQFEDAGKKGDDDSILVPPAPTTLFIKSLSPDISRADLETHCKQVDGFDYIALGEPNPLKRFHRIGWVVFKPDANMDQAEEKLCESKINNFTLHMHRATTPTYQRLRVAPSLMAEAENLDRSLEDVKQIVSQFEAQAGEDSRGSKAIEEKVSQLRAGLPQPSDGDETSKEEQEEYRVKAEAVTRQALDWNLQLLRSVFHTCYYCICVSDFAEELTRKCVKHVRRPAGSPHPPKGKHSKESETAWVRSHKEKIELLKNKENVDPVDFGGENYQEELSKLCKPHIQVEDEGKFRCKTCKKLFKAAPFVEKHILNKHADLLGDKLEQLKYYNNFVLDPSHVMPPMSEGQGYANANHPSNAAFYSSGMASTFGAFNQMFGGGNFGGYGGMMGGYGGFNMPMWNQPMSFNGFGGGGPGFNGPLSADARSLNNRIGDRADGFGMGGQPIRLTGSPANKRQRRGDAGPPPPPKGAKIDPRAGRLHAYTDLDGPPAGGGEDMMLDY